MEAAPPSYEKAILVNAWDLIATYIASSDLCSAALVSSTWHAIFIPHLWGNPAAHFSQENDQVYVALTRFKRTLPWARLYVRSFTHTLHLPPAHAELYNGPHADWLREVLDRLPNLQSLVVRGLPFFDHAALTSLQYRPPQKEPVTHPVAHAVELPASVLPLSFPRQLNSSFGLRLLDASRCTNTTASGLCEALKRLDQLLYLDLSYTHATRDRGVLDTLKTYSGLQVLKLRGINLRDEDIETLAPAIGTRVRSLDLRNNLLTDSTARLLLEDCFLKSHAFDRPRTPPLIHYLGPEMLATYQGADFEAYLRNAFTTHFVGRLAFEDAPEGGITHLYISENQLSVEGISGLIRSGRLHVLDAKVDNSRRQSSDVSRPGAEKLAYLFAGPATDSIRYLRINHEMVTKRLSRSGTETSVVAGLVELSDRESVPMPECAELPDSSAVFELSADIDTPRELPGDVPGIVTPARPVIQPTPDEAAAFDQARRGSAVAPEAVSGMAAFDQARRGNAVAPEAVSEMAAFDQARRGSAVAPEAVSGVAAFDQARRGSAVAPEAVSGSVETPALLLYPPVAAVDSPSPFPNLSSMNEALTRSPMLDSAIPGLPSRAPSNVSSSRPRTLSNVRSQRQARSNYLRTQEGFHPGLVPHLKILVLTDVPLQSEDSTVSDRLVEFLQECAEDSTLARKQAASDYTLPPGRRQSTNALKDIAGGFFALETVILEMASHNQVRSGRWRPGASLTNGRDSQALWKESESDFSFFGETEEVTFPSLDPPGRSMFMQAMAGKESCTDVSYAPKPVPSETPWVDNIARISAFRKSKKAEYQDRLSRGHQDPEVEGYWPGVVQVVRTAGNADPFAEGEEALDYFGNSFSKGYLYK